MKLIVPLFAAVVAVAASAATGAAEPIPVNGCVTFTVSAGTGCAWMCNYCSGTLSTNNYYFTTDVCTYQEGAGCVGNPQAGVPYTCCSAADDSVEEMVEAVDVDERCEADDQDKFSSCEDEGADADSDADADLEIWVIKVHHSKA
jgi:hypothetical protein